MSQSIERAGVINSALLVALGVSCASIGLNAVVGGKRLAMLQLIIGVVLGCLLCWLAWRNAGAPRAAGSAPADPMAASASRWMRGLARTRQFPEVEIAGITLPDGERALLSALSTMMRQRVRDSRQTGGVRVMVGVETFVFGRNETLSRQALRSASSGRLTLTDQAVLFSGQGRAFTIALTRIRSIEPYSREAIKVSIHGDVKPSIFLVANPILWSLVVRLAVRVPLTDGQIPDGVTIDCGSASGAQPA